MSKKVYYYTSHLAHHGIKGQKWGVENGPPYPLGSGDCSSGNRKPSKILYENQKCEFYKEDK